MRWLALGIALLPAAAGAAELRNMYRGTRASAMGGALIAVVDDEQSIFFNPAALAGIKKLTFNYVAADLEVSTDTISSFTDGGNAFSSFSASSLNAFMGQNNFAHAQVAPSLVMPGFGIAFLSDHQLALSERNVAYPTITLGLQSTNGIQAAYGVSVLGRRTGRSDLRVGIAGKLMYRRGGYRTLGFLELLDLTQGGRDYLNGVIGDYGRGYGVDLGTQYLFEVNKRLTLSSALVMTDIGDTAFGDSLADPQKSDLAFGLGATYQLPRAKLVMAYDHRHILGATDFRGRNRLGVEVALPMFSVYGGLYQMALTYGASVDLWMFRITAASYAEEQGTYANQNPSRRYALRVALKVGF